jgi:hypothetical protein
MLLNIYMTLNSLAEPSNISTKKIKLIDPLPHRVLMLPNLGIEAFLSATPPGRSFSDNQLS